MSPTVSTLRRKTALPACNDFGLKLGNGGPACGFVEPLTRDMGVDELEDGLEALLEP